jgi:hypothetical protein
MTCGRWYVDDTLLERLTPHIQDVAAALWPRIQEEDAVVRQGHLTRPRHLAAPDQPPSGGRVRRGATRPRGDRGGAGAGAAGDTLGARRLEGFGEAPRGQDGGQPPRQPRLPHPRWTEEEAIGVSMPASRSA